MIEGDDWIAISALQHLVYCERQAALIHVDRIWRENGPTARGRIVHERPDTVGLETRRGVRVARGMRLWSEPLLLQGVADFVEFRSGGDGDPELPVPCEVKSGRSKQLRADRIQLCAQALCLEYMYRVAIPEAVIYYAGSHRRASVALDATLRGETVASVSRLRHLIETRTVPAPEYSRAKCGRCSLEQECLPRALRRRGRGRQYLEKILQE